eukprot:GDKJ01026620.1.p1 GENE.GDKJ01026620.1~~GDKJ01026620.1.p1  ORF type:complete len:179 (+),score=19.97 GDKJ01026620.1:28-564(+)
MPLQDLSDQLQSDEVFVDFCIFDSSFTVLICKNTHLSVEQMLYVFLSSPHFRCCSNIFNDPKQYLKSGINLFSEHFQITRVHHPLVIARCRGSFDGLGACVIQGFDKSNNIFWIVATFSFPFVSAKAIPHVMQLFETHVGSFSPARPFVGSSHIPLPPLNEFYSQYTSTCNPPPGILG